MADVIALEVLMALPSVSNQRLHWAKKAKQTKDQRVEVAWCFRVKHSTAGTSWRSMLPVEVTLIRQRPKGGRAYDDDNLRAAFKAVRDAVAFELGVTDNDPRVAWRYADEKSGNGLPYVRIEIAPRAA
jgi:hypothetical protein